MQKKKSPPTTHPPPLLSPLTSPSPPFTPPVFCFPLLSPSPHCPPFPPRPLIIHSLPHPPPFLSLVFLCAKRKKKMDLVVKMSVALGRASNSATVPSSASVNFAPSVVEFTSVHRRHARLQPTEVNPTPSTAQTTRTQYVWPVTQATDPTEQARHAPPHFLAHQIVRTSRAKVVTRLPPRGRAINFKRFAIPDQPV